MICVSSTSLSDTTLHSFDIKDGTMKSAGFSGWFPLFDARDGRALLISRLDAQSPEKMVVVRIEGDVISSIKDVIPSTPISGPPICWAGPDHFMFSSRDGNGRYLISDISGRVVSFFDLPLWEKPIDSIMMGDGSTAIIVMDIKRKTISLMDREMSKIGTYDGRCRSACGADDGTMVVIEADQPVVRRVDPSSMSEISSFNIPHLEGIDHWRPASSSGGSVSIGINLQTVLFDRKGEPIRHPLNAIHFTMGDVVPRSIVFERSVQVSVPSSESMVARAFSRTPDWHLKSPILILSGCSWSQTGGGQRPAAMARQLSSFGANVIYASTFEQSRRDVDGVFVSNFDPSDPWLEEVMGVPGTLIVCYPLFEPFVDRFRDAGWKIIYDMIDDWDGFVSLNPEMGEDLLECERRIVSKVDECTCTCNFLFDRAIKMGFPYSFVIRNGGPSLPLDRVPLSEEIATGGMWKIIYCGYLAGTWMDWDILRMIDGDDRFALTVIGGLDGVDESIVAGFSENTKFMGNLPYPDAMRCMASGDVGIIPFRGHEICRGVDPIKAYDYWAAGMWVVSTDLVTPLEGMPYTILSSKDGFLESLCDACGRTAVSRPNIEFVRSNSWSDRAGSMMSVITRMKPDTLDHFTNTSRSYGPKKPAQSFIQNPFHSGWWSETPIVVMSGATWNCTGGAQRPIQIARAFARMGRPVIYYNRVQESDFGYVDGVLVIAPGDWERAFGEMDALGVRPGIVLCSFGSYIKEVKWLVERGWTLVYDMLDDWDAFVEIGQFGKEFFEGEDEMISLSSLVTYSAPHLEGRVINKGGTNRHLVLNAGPGELLSRRIPSIDMATEGTRVVFSGSIWGKWVDRGLMERIASLPGVSLNVIGQYDSSTKIRGANHLGELPYPKALEVISSSHVGVIPFLDCDVSRSVDPLKAYDYWAAGIWTVATPSLEYMIGRPFTIISDGEGIADAIAEAADRRVADPVTKEWVVGNSWGERAYRIMSLAIPIVTTRRKERGGLKDVEDCKVMVTVRIPSSCNMVPPCPYCYNSKERFSEPSLSSDPNEWLSALRGLADRFGPIYFAISHGDSMSDIRVVEIAADLAIDNHVDLCSNLFFPIEMLEPLPRNGNIALATSFHPIPWGMSTEPFIRKRMEIEDAGIECGVAMVVGYPPFVERIPAWKEEFAAAGIEMWVNPFRGMHGGRSYPSSYTEEEAAIVYGEVEAVRGMTTPMMEGVRGKRCRVGMDYLMIDQKGDVHHCPYDIIPVGNIFDSEFSLREEPTICQQDCCGCADLWRYIEDD